MAERNRGRLERLVKYFGLALALAVVYVMLDFAIDFRPPGVQSSYFFSLDEVDLDRPRILRQDNLSIVVIRRSPQMRARLDGNAAGLQDADSRDSVQPDYARNPLRSRNPEWFVGYAIGTDFGCPLEILAETLREVCGDAAYDFAGRALEGGKSFRNLTIPDYNFTRDFSSLTIRP